MVKSGNIPHNFIPRLGEATTIVTPRQAVLVALVALVPVSMYGIVQGDVLAGIAALNVVIVTVSLFIAFETIEESRSEMSGTI